jgi:CheY-like chemotaxis protein
MRGVFRRLIHNVSLPRRKGISATKLPSMVKAMHRLVPRKVMREVIASSHDRRQWGVLAAAWVGVSETEFFQAAATEMGLPLEERIIPCDLSTFGDRGRTILKELRAAGIMIAASSAEVTRLIAVDPAEVRGLSFYDPRCPVALGSWSAISQALDATERLLIEFETNTERREALKRNEVCRKILNILIREADAHGAYSLDVVSTASGTRYQFLTRAGKIAAGGIRADVVQELLSYLCSLEGGVFKSDSHGDAVLRALGSSANFRISWGAQRMAHDLPETPRERSASSDEPRVASSLPTRHTAAANSDGIPVLVVDDNPMFCRVLERLLIREGFRPSYAENGVEAMERLAWCGEVLPAAIVCDLHMPHMNGREFIAKVKGDARLKGVPIIVLTSDEDVEAELELLAEGAEAFVSKARDPRVLTTQLQRVLRRGGVREAA